jgi:hypothetical protein
MTGGAEAAGAAGEHQEVFRVSVWTANADKPAVKLGQFKYFSMISLTIGPK